MFDAFQTFSDSQSASPNSETILTIVFEHVDQDLSMFLQRCPSPGLSEHLIKVLTSSDCLLRCNFSVLNVKKKVKKVKSTASLNYCLNPFSDLWFLYM